MPTRLRLPHDWWWSSNPPIPSTEFTILSSSDIKIIDPLPSLNTLTAEDTDPVDESNDLFPILMPPNPTPDSTIQLFVRSGSDHSSLLSTTGSTTISLSFTNALAVNTEPVCLGYGLDAASEGILASIVVSSALGLLFWVRCRLFLPDLANSSCHIAVFCNCQAAFSANI
jgi:calcium permeable stress-gated cation channel